MRANLDAARFVAALLLGGYGALILLGLLAHESRLVGAGLLVAGGLLLAVGRRTDAPPVPAVEVTNGRRIAVLLLGLAAAGGVLLYNGIARSTLVLPEVATLVYGVALLVALPHLGRRVGRTDVGTLVAWSIPLVAAPLALYALDAAIDAQVRVGSSPLDWSIRHLLVAPTSFALTLLGFDAVSNGQSITMATDRGSLVLHVGVVCAGLQPGVLFLGVFALYAWQERTPPGRLAALLALGLAGVYVANLVRLVVLALVGQRWGGAALQTTHEHAGWLLFVGWMIAYWWFVLRRLQGPTRPRAPGAA